MHERACRTCGDFGKEQAARGIFNRSYYEEVPIVRVHPEILRSQGLPDELLDEKESKESGLYENRTQETSHWSSKSTRLPDL